MNETSSHRRYVIGGLVVLYLLAAVLAVRWQLRSPSWDPALEPYVAFVEKERGLTFDEPVAVRWADINTELAEDFAADRADRSDVEQTVDPLQEAYALLGLVELDPEVTFDERAEDTAAEQAGAFYDPYERAIVLPEDVSLEDLGYTIVHELTHALQDQNGMLDRRAESVDSSSARTALIEGDAERIAVAWFDQLDPAEQDRLLGSESDGDGETVEPFDDVGNSFLDASFEASYALGLPAVNAIVAREGQVGIDRLLRSKDVGTSERLIDVLTDSPRPSVGAYDVITLPEDVEFIDGDIGATIWFRALAPSIGSANAFDALVGYDDDAFVMMDRGDERCGRFVLSFDTPVDTVEFADLAGEVMAGTSMNGLTVAENDSAERAVEFELCSPIGSPEDQRLGTILPLIVANEMAVVHLRNGVPVEQARCAALTQAATIPADQGIDRFIGWEAIDRAAVDYVDGCGVVSLALR